MIIKDDFISIFLENMFYIFNRKFSACFTDSSIEEGEMPNGETNPRAVILTAIPVEYQAVRLHLEGLSRETHKDSIYERGTFSVGNRTWDIMIAETDPGNMSAAIAAERVINYFDPVLVLFVGVAGGLKDVGLGDIVAATKVYGYESGKANTTFLPRPDVGNSSFRMVELAKAEGREKDWLKRIKGILPKRDPKVYVKPIAAGEKVVDSTRSETFAYLTTHYGDALAVEMEGRGFLQAVHQNRQVDALIIRGISDLIEKKSKTDAHNWQETAAGYASAFAFEILAKLDIKELQKNTNLIESPVQEQIPDGTDVKFATDTDTEQLPEHEIRSDKTSTMSLIDYIVRTEKMSMRFSGGLEVYPDACESAIDLMKKLDDFLQQNYKLDSSPVGLMVSNTIEEIRKLIGDLHNLAHIYNSSKQKMQYTNIRVKVNNSFSFIKSRLVQFSNIV